MNDPLEVQCPKAETCHLRQGCPHTVIHEHNRLTCTERLFGDCPECCPPGTVSLLDEEPEETIVRTLVQCENTDNCRKWGSPPDHCSHAKPHPRGENCFEPCPHGGYCEPAPGVVQLRYEILLDDERSV